MHLQGQAGWDRGGSVVAQEVLSRPLYLDGSRRGLEEEWEEASRTEEASSSAEFMLDAWRR